MGKMDVAVLDGGLPKWQAEGHEIEDMPPMVRDRHITVQRQSGLVKDVTQVASASKLAEVEIIDARAAARFKGEAAEPRPGLRSGHIPNSKNLPFGTLLNGNSTLKALDELRATFEAAGVDLSKPAITTCGSGVTAAILSLALERIGHRNHALYDGSWSEWGMYDDLPIAKG
jgi:thiosulfate/3-mercaptopyruvate sulfurtransferase